MRTATAILLGLSFIAVSIGAAGGAADDGARQALQLQKGTEVHFATVQEAAAVLGSADGFVKAMGPFDRSARLKTDRAVSQEEFLKFAARQAVAWKDDEVAEVTRKIEIIGRKIAPLHLPLPARVLLIKTTGKEEGNACYCRDNAIVLPADELVGLGQRLLIHELFHILSRNNPKLRDALYAVVGFDCCGAVELPAEVRDRRITNPDAFTHEHCVELRLGGKAVHVVPVLLARSAYDKEQGGEFFDYMELRLMEVRQSAGRWAPAKGPDGKAVLLTSEDAAEAYLDKIGRNTRYVIHPEEVLADNFVLLVERPRSVPTPRILDGMKRALAAHAAGAGPATQPSPPTAAPPKL